MNFDWISPKQIMLVFGISTVVNKCDLISIFIFEKLGKININKIYTHWRQFTRFHCYIS